jgi:hypothetical protein
VKISFWVSTGKSRMVLLVAEVRLGFGVAIGFAVSIVGDLLVELSGSNPMMLKV